MLSLCCRELSLNIYYLHTQYSVLFLLVHITIRWNRSCTASNSACCYILLHSVPCLCRLSHLCTLLKPFDGFRCHLAGRLMASSVLDRGPWTHRGKADLGSNPQPKHAIANCSPTISPMLPPGEYKRGVWWTCDSDSAFCPITLVLVLVC